MIACPYTCKSKALNLANELRILLESQLIIDGNPITASFGISDIFTSLTLPKLLSDADACMYRSKRNGRNCCTAK
ncbi:hypothetical protein ACFL53_02825 [Pseudomonadota bacterium]